MGHLGPHGQVGPCCMTLWSRDWSHPLRQCLFVESDPHLSSKPWKWLAFGCRANRFQKPWLILLPAREDGREGGGREIRGQAMSFTSGKDVAGIVIHLAALNCCWGRGNAFCTDELQLLCWLCVSVCGRATAFYLIKLWENQGSGILISEAYITMAILFIPLSEACLHWAFKDCHYLCWMQWNKCNMIRKISK